MTVETVTSENLAEFNAARTPQAEEVADPIAEQAAAELEKLEAEKAKAEEAEKAEKAERPKLGINKRFSELTDKAKAAEARAEAAEARARELEAKVAPPKTENTKPNPAEFTDAFEYAEKLSEWKVNEALRTRDKEAAEATAREESDKVVKAFQRRMETARAEIDGFDDALAESNLAVHDAVRDSIMESDVGPQMLHYLATNPEHTERINGMSVRAALREIGKLEAKLEAKPEPKEEKPVKREPLPEPISAIKRGAGADDQVNSPGEFKGSYAQWKAMRQRQQA